MQEVRNRAALERIFIGEDYFTLALTIGPLQDLEEILGVGVSVLFSKFSNGTWASKEIQHTVRLGLVGGGMDTEAAYNLVNRNVVSGHLLEYVVVAKALLQAALVGVKEDAVGTPDESGEKPPVESPPTPPAESNGQNSTSSAARPATRSKKSEK